MQILNKRNLYSFVLMVALASMLGSLYFSEIIGLMPCVLCWYQRILMYPLVFIAAAGLWSRDKLLPRYILPMSVIGTLIAAYHYTLQMYQPAASNSLFNCTKGGVACTIIDISYFGFITIPLLSFIAFLLITIAMLVSVRVDR